MECIKFKNRIRNSGKCFCRKPPSKSQFSLGKTHNRLPCKDLETHKSCNLSSSAPVNPCFDKKVVSLGLASHKIRSDLVLICKATLNKLADRARVTLLWVPRHCRIAENEQADELVRAGSSNTDLEEASIKISMANIKTDTEK